MAWEMGTYTRVSWRAALRSGQWSVVSDQWVLMGAQSPSGCAGKGASRVRSGPCVPRPSQQGPCRATCPQKLSRRAHREAQTCRLWQDLVGSGRRGHHVGDCGPDLQEEGGGLGGHLWESQREEGPACGRSASGTGGPRGARTQQGPLRPAEQTEVGAAAIRTPARPPRPTCPLRPAHLSAVLTGGLSQFPNLCGRDSSAPQTSPDNTKPGRRSPAPASPCTPRPCAPCAPHTVTPGVPPPPLAGSAGTWRRDVAFSVPFATGRPGSLCGRGSSWSSREAVSFGEPGVHPTPSQGA